MKFPPYGVLKDFPCGTLVVTIHKSFNLYADQYDPKMLGKKINIGGKVLEVLSFDSAWVPELKITAKNISWLFVTLVSLFEGPIDYSTGLVDLT